MSLKKIIKESTSIPLIKRIKSLETVESINVDITDYDKIGEGAYAEVFTKKNKTYVIRVEKNGGDVDNTIYEKLSEVKRGTYKNLVHIYYFKELKDLTTITVMEKLDSITKNENKFIDTIFSVFFINGIFDEKKIRQFSDGKGFDKLVNDILNGIEEYRKVTGFNPIDLHGNNVLKDSKTGNYKIIDLAQE